MSKIYEALLRAEQERATKTGPHANGVRSAEETALANTLEEYVPEPDQQFGSGLHFPTVPQVHPAPEPASQGMPPTAEPSSVAPIAWPAPAQMAAAPMASPAWVPAAAPVPVAAPVPTLATVPVPTAGLAAVAPVSVIPAPQVSPAQAYVAPLPETAPEVSPVSLETANLHPQPWHPVTERLPALAERGQTVEQFRSLRSRLAEFRDSSTPLKSIVVTSGLPQEGKSFIAANLALSLSRHRANRVLLIDGDIRRSSLHAMLGTAAEPGLTEYLSGQAELADVLQRCEMEDSEAAFHNGLSSLAFIPGGGEPEKAADLSGSPRFVELLTTLGPLYDWIIIDSSPVNLVSDAVNFARACDGVLLVAREGVTKFETAQNAQQQLKSTRILGFVLNAVHTASSKTDDYNYGPYGTYGSYGGYGYSTTKR